MYSSRVAKKLVNRRSALGRGNYAQVIDRILEDKVCPFCEKHFLKYHTRPILRRSAHWIVTENFNPYPGTKQHLLLVHRGHIESPKKLSAKAWKELLVHLNWLQKKLNLPGGALFMRFGDLGYTGASVAHLHANIISAEKEGAGKERLAVTLGFKKKKNPRA